MATCKCIKEQHESSADKIKRIKEKYKNGVTKEILEEWLKIRLPEEARK